MKKITLLILATFFSVSFAFSQTAESLLKAKAKSDADIENPKKKIKPATWEKRAIIFLDMAQLNTKGLYKGMPQKGLTGAETVVGKPSSVETKDDGEVWVYERINLTFVNGLLSTWKETKPVDVNAVALSKESYLKAIELDTKDKVKNKDLVKRNIAILRGLYSDKGVGLYTDKKYVKAVEAFEQALELDKFPKVKGDTIFNTGLITYYTGVFAQNGKDLAKAEKYYLISVENGYEGGKPYHGLASIYAEQNDNDKEIGILTKGFDKHPDSKEILFDFINYYLRIGNSEGAMAKIEEAIKVNPENYSLYFAKSTLFEEMVKDSTDKYSAEEKTKLSENAVKGYKKALEIKPDYFNALFNLGIFYYNKAVTILKKAGNLPLSAKAQYEKEKIKADENYKLAIPYLEKASEIKPDKTTLRTLSTMYIRLSMYDKNKIVKEKMDNLPEEAGGL